MNRKKIIILTTLLILVFSLNVAFAATTLNPSEVNVTIYKIELKSSNGSYISVFEGNQTSNFASSTAQLPALSLTGKPAGTYTAIRFTVDTTVGYRVDGSGNGWYSDSRGQVYQNGEPTGSFYVTQGNSSGQTILCSLNGATTGNVNGTIISVDTSNNKLTMEVPLQNALVITESNDVKNLSLSITTGNSVFIENEVTGVASSYPPIIIQ